MSPKLIDIHTHSDKIPENVMAIRNTELNATGNDFMYSAGIHPWQTVNHNPADVQLLKEHAQNCFFMAVGETGLDKTKGADFQTQLKFFTLQLQIAEEYNKPVIIHCVRAYSEILQIRKDFNKTPWIIHGFNANEDIAGKLTEKKCFLSFGPFLFNEKSKAFGVFSKINPEDFFLETDDSGLSINEVYNIASGIMIIDKDVLQEKIYNNFARCFRHELGTQVGFFNGRSL